MQQKKHNLLERVALVSLAVGLFVALAYGDSGGILAHITIACSLMLGFISTALIAGTAVWQLD